jgi:Mannosyltransferase (PIG-V)
MESAVESVRSRMRVALETTYYISGAGGGGAAIRSAGSHAKGGRYNLKMLRKLASRPDWQIALAATAALRVFYSMLAAVAAVFLHPDPRAIQSNGPLTENLPAPHGLHYAWLGIWERFDTLWFLRIAEHGYDRPMAVIFYPLYPAAIRLVSELISPLAAAILVSTVAAFFLFLGLLRLAGGELSEVGRVRMLLLFCMWPTSFVLFAGYAESLTQALLVWAIIFGRKARWEAATACGLLAGSARPSGVLVFVPLAIMALRSRQARSLIVALTPLGLLIYWGWLRWSGRPSVVEAYRLYQGMTMVPPWRGLGEALWLIVTEHDTLLAIKLGLVILVAVITLRRQVRIEDKTFALVVILQMLMYTGRPLLGAARYLLIVYPAFLVLGAYAERWNGKQFGFYLGCFGFLNLAWMWAFLNWSLVL